MSGAEVERMAQEKLVEWFKSLTYGVFLIAEWSLVIAAFNIAAAHTDSTVVSLFAKLLYVVVAGRLLTYLYYEIPYGTFAPNTWAKKGRPWRVVAHTIDGIVVFGAYVAMVNYIIPGLVDAAEAIQSVN